MQWRTDGGVNPRHKKKTCMMIFCAMEYSITYVIIILIIFMVTHPYSISNKLILSAYNIDGTCIGILYTYSWGWDSSYHNIYNRAAAWSECCVQVWVNVCVYVKRDVREHKDTTGDHIMINRYVMMKFFQKSTTSEMQATSFSKRNAMSTCVVFIMYLPF